MVARKNYNEKSFCSIFSKKSGSEKTQISEQQHELHTDLSKIRKQWTISFQKRNEHANNNLNKMRSMAHQFM